MNKHAYWLAAAVVGLAGCAGNPEPVKVPQKKAGSGCFLNCEVPENLGKQYLDGALPGDLVRVERVNSRHGTHTIDSAETLGIGTQAYELVKV